jgi:hypothetical protein
MACRRLAAGRDGAPTPRRLRSLVSSLGLAAAASLVVLHLSILWERIAQGRMGEPDVALRWVAAAVLLVASLALRRRGVSLLWGRRALVFWLLVLLLHAGTAVPQAPVARVAPEQLLFVVPAAVAPACLVLVLLVAPRAGAAPADPRAAWLPHAACRAPARRAGFPLALASRPPPA